MPALIALLRLPEGGRWIASELGFNVGRLGPLNSP